MSLRLRGLTRPRRVTWAAAWALSLALPFWLSAGGLTTATFVVIAAIGAVGLNVLTGMTGQISIGHAFFLAVGATVAAVLGADHGLSAVVWLPAAGVVAALFGVLVGPIALRLSGLYLAVVTIGLVLVGQHVLLNVTAFSGGPAGRTFPPVTVGGFDFAPGQQLAIAGLVIDRDGLYYFLSLAILALALLFVRNLMHSRTGRGMRAVAQRELVASLMGVRIASTKVVAFAVSSFLGGVCGALYASYLSYAQPAQCDLQLSIQFLAAIIIGGMGTLAGPVIGTAIVFGAPSLLAQLPFVSQQSTGLTSGELAAILYGTLIVVFLVLEPRGVVGIWGRLQRRPNLVRRRQRVDAETVGSAVPALDSKEEEMKV
jgi:branched-chain amino acid transport system permease protein